MNHHIAIWLSAALSAWASTVNCPDLFTAINGSAVLPIRAVDHDWKIAKAKSLELPSAKADTLKNGAAHRLMNEALFPLVAKLSSVLKRVDETEIRKRLSKLDKEFPIHKGSYVDGIPNPDPHFNGSEFKKLRSAAIGADFYKPNEMSGRASHFFYTEPDLLAKKALGITFDLFTSNVTPIGLAYGEEFSKRLLRTDQIVMELALENLKKESAETYLKNSELLLDEAGRVRMAKFEGAVPELSPLGSVSEGFHTLHQLVSQLTIDKVPGSETGAQALKAIVSEGAARSGLTTDFTRQLPLAIVGPSAHSGRYFPNPLVLDGNGKLDIAEHVKQALTKYREKAKPFRNGRRTCPMAALFFGRDSVPAETQAAAQVDTTGIQLTAEAYWHIFQMVERVRSHP